MYRRRERELEKQFFTLRVPLLAAVAAEGRAIGSFPSEVGPIVAVVGALDPDRESSGVDGLYARLRADVLARTPVDEREEVSIERFVVEFDRLDDPLSQEADLVHVTASGVVVGSRGVVLLKHKRLGLWLQPGGHIDAGETPWEAAQRETEEETGLTARFAGPTTPTPWGDAPELLHVDVHAGGRGHTHLDLRYLIDGGDADPAPPEDESQEIGWFDWDTAISMTDPGLAGCLRALRPPQPFP